MGQKVNPVSNRLGIIRGWDSSWFGKYDERLVEDSEIRKYLNARLAKASAQQWHDNLLDSVAEFDDEMMEKYLDDASAITQEDILRAVRKGTVAQKLVPVVCGSSFRNKGVQPRRRRRCSMRHVRCSTMI